MATFGQKLKALQEHLEMSQEELGNLINSSKQVISRYETEINSPRIDVRICEDCDVRIIGIIAGWVTPEG